MEHAVRWEVVEHTFAEAKRWLAVDQPEGAWMSHHGRSNYCGGGLTVSFAPRGVLGGGHDQANTMVVVFELAVQNYGEHDQFDPAPFDQATLDGLEHVAVSTFGPAIDSWNGGVGSTTWSLLFPCAQTGASVAVANYHRGCPRHGGPFCTGQADWHDGCTFANDHHALLTPPGFVAAVEGRAPVPQEPRSRSAEVVADVLDRIRPLLVGLGFHDQLVQPSSAGTIDGEVGERVFTAGNVERLGIQLPAESFAELVRLAVIGHEVDGDQ